MKRLAILLFVLIGVLSACRDPKGSPDASTFKSAAAFATPGQVGPFVIPQSWKQTTWGLDGQNSSGCASDNNRTCAATSCSSDDGPCLTFGSIATRWGTYKPRLQQVTTITSISNASSTSDLMYLDPIVEGSGNYLAIVCTLGATQQAWSGTLGTVTARNRSTGQLLTSVLSSGSVAVGQLLVNATHPSRAYTTAIASGTTWEIDQPLTACTSPSCSVSEVNTWTTGDSVVAYTPSTIYVPEIFPSNFAGTAFGGSQLVFISACTLGAPDGSNGEATRVNQYGGIAESQINTELQDTVNSSYSYGGRYVNDSFSGAIEGGSEVFFGSQLIAPRFDLLTQPTFFYDTELFDVIYVTGVSSYTGQGGFSVRSGGGLYIGGDLYIEGGYFSLDAPLWGGPLYVNSGAFVTYNSPAVSIFFTSSLEIANSTTACSYSISGLSCGISITPTTIDAAAGISGFGGTAFSLSGGAITNVQQ